ncbi:hypothetical protein RQP46_004310 [Phenoliferia psychrophenolica]
MLSAFGLAQPELKLAVEEEMLYLHPVSEDGPSEDPSIWGIVTLFLPKPRTLKSLTVRLVGTQIIGWNGVYPYEETTSLFKTVSLIPEGEDAHLDKGGHTFTFSLIVPSSTPSHERCEHGRVRHTIRAKAKGIGAMGGDIETSETQLFLIQNSQHIMVAGLLLFKLSLISTSTKITIHSLKVLIHQRFHLRSAVSEHEHHTPVDARTVLLLDVNRPANDGILLAPDAHPISRSSSRIRGEAPFKVVEEGASFQVKHLAKIPNGESVRPTTLAGSTSGISVSHSLVFEMIYSAGEDAERHTMSISKPLEIYSVHPPSLLVLHTLS